MLQWDGNPADAGYINALGTDSQGVVDSEVLAAEGLSSLAPPVAVGLIGLGAVYTAYNVGTWLQEKIGGPDADVGPPHIDCTWYVDMSDYVFYYSFVSWVYPNSCYLSGGTATTQANAAAAYGFATVSCISASYAHGAIPPCDPSIKDYVYAGGLPPTLTASHCDATCQSGATYTQNPSFTRPATCGTTCLNGFLTGIAAGTTGTPAQQATKRALKHFLDPNYPYGTFPNCVGDTQEQCTDALAAAGFNGTFEYDPATLDGADLSQPAGAVITQPDTAGSTVSLASGLVFTVNPDPLPVIWPSAETSETYDQYLSRLRAIGWLGTATTSQLGSEEGDLAYVASGVPCTSVVSGVRVDPSTPVTFYENPSSSFAPDEHGFDGGSCGGGYASSMGDCEFNDDITKSDGAWTWSDTQVDECREAWQILEDKVIIENGQPSSDAISVADHMDIDIANPKVVAALSGSITAWDKVGVSSWNGEDLITSSGKHFELHFYKKLDGTINTDFDYKIVFTDPIP
jgi:hypothetical protein